MTLEKDEFSAACMEMGIALKTQDEKDQLFVKLAEGNPEISFEQFQVYSNDACFSCLSWFCSKPYWNYLLFSLRLVYQFNSCCLSHSQKWMKLRLVVSLDDPESVKNAFKTLADGADTLAEGHMGTTGTILNIYTNPVHPTHTSKLLSYLTYFTYPADPNFMVQRNVSHQY
jgi:hypothetical protein